MEDQALPTLVQKTNITGAIVIPQGMTEETSIFAETQAPAATESEENKPPPPAGQTCSETTDLYSTLFA